MRKLSYWLCFTLVAIPALVGLAGLFLYYFFGTGVPARGLLNVLLSFGSLVPPFLAHIVPHVVALVLGYVLLALVARRLWLLVAKKEGVPQAYTGLPKVLGYIATWSFLLAVLGILLSMLLRVGSGVPAGMLLLPAVVCTPWAIFLTELLSLRSASKREV